MIKPDYTEPEPAPAATPAPASAVPASPVPASAVPASPAPPGAGPEGELLPERSQEDTDAAWGDLPERDDDRLYRDRPPHWDDY